MSERISFGYYKKRQNRLNECKRLIEKYKTLEGYSKIPELSKFDCAMRTYKENIYDMVEELGYSIEELRPRRKPELYYNDFDKLKKEIEKFILKNKRFPTQDEFWKELNITSWMLQKHGGIYEIKRKMKYINCHDLKDDNGFYNKSIQEYYVAQFLINQKITYQRERRPFDDYDYLSDFKLTGIDNTIYFLEVWGFNEGTSERAENYKIKMRRKIDLYKKYNLNLLSIHPSTFRGKTIKEINGILFDIFKQILNIQFKDMGNDVYIPKNTLTDDELKYELMMLSKNGKTIPTQRKMLDEGKYQLYVEIHKRFGSMFAFAEKYNLQMEHYNFNYWCKETIFNRFDYMICTWGRILNKSEMESEEYKYQPMIKGLIGGIRRNGGFVTLRLSYYRNLIDKKLFFPDSEITILKKIINKMAPYNKVNPLIVEISKKIYEDIPT